MQMQKMWDLFKEMQAIDDPAALDAIVQEEKGKAAPDMDRVGMASLRLSELAGAA